MVQPLMLPARFNINVQDWRKIKGFRKFNGRPLNLSSQIWLKKNLAKRKFCEIVKMLLNFVKLGGLQLSGKTISWVEIFLGGNFLGGNYLMWEFFGWELSRWEFSGWELSNRNHLGGNFLGGSFPTTENCSQVTDFLPT